MAIRIPILTSFDPKGLRQANAQFAKLQGSIGSLGRNFAVAGAAIAGATAIIAKNAQALARIETINAQTAQTIKSMGNVAGISATEIETLAGSLEALTATEAEAIQEGANLLLTFGNIRNEMGKGNDIFTQTAEIMVDVGRALRRGPVETATMLGKALNDPIRGMTALTRVGVSFSDEQRNQVKALQDTGDLMGAQKVILAELQRQYGGSGAAFAQTFTGQLELMGHELGTIGEQATMAVMPALQGMVEELRDVIPLIGPQLKAAIESVDWKALVKSVVDFTTFLVNNATTIGNLIVGIFALNTAFKLMAVASGIAKTAIALKTYFVAQAAAGMTIATVATNIFSTALKLIPFVAVAAGIGLIIAGITEADSSYRTATPNVTSFGGELLKTGHDAEWAAGKYGIATEAVKSFNRATLETPTSVPFLGTGFAGLDALRKGTAVLPGAPTPTPTPTGGASGSAAARQASPLQQLIQESNKTAAVLKREGALERAGLTKEVAQWVTSSNKPIKAAREAQARIAKNGAKAVANLTKSYIKSATGQQAAASAAAEASAQAQAAHNAMVAAAQAAAAREAAALAERERVYKAFQDSVVATFAGIKNAILGAFDLTQLGGSTNAITRNMDKLLTRLRSFATNVTKLSGMGLDPALLQQVIAAGPLAGARLAQTLVAGGANALNSINAGFNEFGALSSQIAQTGTESLFNRQAQQNIYNIEVSGGVGSGATIGKAIVDAIKSYERTSGAVFQGA